MRLVVTHSPVNTNQSKSQQEESILIRNWGTVSGCDALIASHYPKKQDTKNILGISRRIVESVLNMVYTIVFLRSIVFSVLLPVYTLFFLPIIPILYLLGKNIFVRKILRIWSFGIVIGLKTIVGITHKQIGNLNSHNGPVIYVSNHQSLWETIVFHAIFLDVAVVFKDSLYRIPVIGWYLRNSPMIAVNRNAGASAMKAMFRQATEVLAEGRSILIFPEGTRLPLYSNENYHRGVVFLYRKFNLPVVPVAINSGVLWPPRSILKNSGKITVSLLDAIQPGMDSEEFLKKLQTTIGREKDRLVKQLIDAPNFRKF